MCGWLCADCDVLITVCCVCLIVVVGRCLVRVARGSPCVVRGSLFRAVVCCCVLRCVSFLVCYLLIVVYC